MALFRNRAEAGKKLSIALSKYRGEEAVIFALPRGGVVTGAMVAKTLKLPLDLIITRKIGHPREPEYGIAAVSENGHMTANLTEVASVDPIWLKKEAARQRLETIRRRGKYLPGRLPLPAEGKIAILIDDGIATGLTIKAAIMEIKHRHPKKIVVAIPVIPQGSAKELKMQVNELIALKIPRQFLGSIGAYYDNFPQVSDEEVIKLVKDARKFIPKKAVEEYESLVYDD